MCPFKEQQQPLFELSISHFAYILGIFFRAVIINYNFSVDLSAF